MTAANQAELIDACLSTAEVYEDWSAAYDRDETSSDGYAELEAVKLAYEALLLSIPGVLRVTTDYDAQSTYFDLWHTGEDGEEETLQVRVSNHAMRYSGPFASLTTTATRKHIETMVELVGKAIAQ